MRFKKKEKKWVWREKPQKCPIKHLRCKNEYWDGVAVWKRLGAIWSCVDADEELKWLVGMSHEKAKNELLRRGCQWEWH